MKKILFMVLLLIIVFITGIFFFKPHIYVIHLNIPKQQYDFPAKIENSIEIADVDQGEKLIYIKSNRLSIISLKKDPNILNIVNIENQTANWD
ncbi:hypothetical protein [Priestia megaterium]|uniref:Uncharacterized protein n=1 Tax=Priestia megaterium TaxID=1404 RepID=A0A6M6E8R5_PRIMG|nr:hypothetical protein [Priestia megaterium]QJX79985.1 hypothetical protein FDZ14_28185 [Priestia megaterium]